MGKRYFLFIGLVTLTFILWGCAGSSRLEMDYGTSFKLLKLNQISNPDAEKNSEPVAGLDGKAAQASIEKFRKDFEKPAPPTPYSFSIGISGKK